jgi:hypothetical protein
MKKRFLIYLTATCVFSGCDQTPPGPVSSKVPEKKHDSIEPDLTRTFSKELLPRNKADAEKLAEEGQPPSSLAHDTPLMDKKDSGYYSYLGAANEFEAICTFDLPVWVEPVEGRYYIIKHGKYLNGTTPTSGNDPVLEQTSEVTGDLSIK